MIGTCIQQTLDKILSDFRIFYHHSEMQWCGSIEPIDWVNIAFFVGEDVFQHVVGRMHDSGTGLSWVPNIGY